MKLYERPVVLSADDLAEGVYASSGSVVPSADDVQEAANTGANTNDHSNEAYLRVASAVIQNGNMKITVKNIGGKPSYNPAVKVALSGVLYVSNTLSGESVTGSGTSEFRVSFNKKIPAGGEWTCTFPVEGNASVTGTSIISR